MAKNANQDPDGGDTAQKHESTVTPSASVTLNGASTTSAPSAGGAGALPATPLGYLTVTVNGVARKIAYY